MSKNSIKNVKDQKPIYIDLDRKRKIEFNMNAYAALEEKFGSVEDAIKSLENPTIKVTRTFLWAALIQDAIDNGEYDPDKGIDFTEFMVGKLLGSIENIEFVIKSINTELANTLPDREDAAKNSPNPPQEN